MMTDSTAAPARSRNAIGAIHAWRFKRLYLVAAGTAQSNEWPSALEYDADGKREISNCPYPTEPNAQHAAHGCLPGRINTSVEDQKNINCLCATTQGQ